MPVYIPGSSVNERQLDIWHKDAPGQFTRPRPLADYATHVNLRVVYGQPQLAITWKDGSYTEVASNAIACWAVTPFGDGQ